MSKSLYKTKVKSGLSSVILKIRVLNMFVCNWDLPLVLYPAYVDSESLARKHSNGCGRIGLVLRLVYAGRDATKDQVTREKS